MVFGGQWQEMPDLEPVRNGYRVGWELFLRHVVEDAPFPSPFLEGQKRPSRRSLLPEPPGAPLDRSAETGTVISPEGVLHLTITLEALRSGTE